MICPGMPHLYYLFPSLIPIQVDQSGVIVAGFGIFGGATHYDYELELLEFQSEPPLGDAAGGVGAAAAAETLLTHSQRWTALEIAKGQSFYDDDDSWWYEVFYDDDAWWYVVSSNFYEVLLLLYDMIFSFRCVWTGRLHQRRCRVEVGTARHFKGGSQIRRQAA